MSKATRTAGWILLFGTLWGASEVILNDALRALEAPSTSVVLTVVSILVLGLAATRLPAFGTLFLVAVVAGAYRTATAGPFWCHVLALLATGLVVDGLRLRLAPDPSRPYRTSVLGGLGAFTAHAAFGLLITYVFAVQHWTGDGGARFREYVLVRGSIAAVASASLLPVAVVVQDRWAKRMIRHPAITRRAIPLALTALLWVVGFLV